MIPPIIATCICGQGYTESTFATLPRIGVVEDMFGGPAVEESRCFCGEPVRRTLPRDVRRVSWPRREIGGQR